MSILLKQSTASQEVLLGPFLDDTDGKTAETALSIANTDIKLWKEGATSEANKNSGGATHIAGGRYYTVLDATDTGTLGNLEINVHMSGALPVKVRCLVLPANVYDSIVAGSDKLQVDVAEWLGTAQTPATAGYPVVTLKVGTGTGELNVASGKAPATLAHTDVSGNLPANMKAISDDSTAADNLEAEYDGTGYKHVIDSGTAQAGTSSTITLKEGSSGTDSYYNHLMIRILSGAGAGEIRAINSYNGTTKVATVTPNWSVSPDGTSTYLLLAMTEVHVKEVHPGAIDASSFTSEAIEAIQSGLATSGEVGDVQAAVDGLNDFDPASDKVQLAATQPDYAPAKVGDQMDLVDAPNETALAAMANTLEAAILDEGDATALLAAIAAKVEEFLINEGDATATLAAIATAVNTAVVSGTVGTSIAAIKAKTDNLPASPAATGDIPSAATVAGQVRTEIATELAHLDADVSSRLASGDYTAPPTVEQIDAELTSSHGAGGWTTAAGFAVPGDAMSLADGAITDAKFTLPAVTGVPTGIVGFIHWIAARMGLARVVKSDDDGTIAVYRADGTTVRTANSFTSTDGTDDVGAAT